MIVKVKALRTEDVEVDLTLKDMYNMMLSSLGIDDRHSKVKVIDNEILFYENTSRHGTHDYEVVHKQRVDDETANIIVTLLDLKDEIDIVSKRLQIKQIEVEKNLLDMKLKHLS